MHQILDFVLKHGYLVIFINVMLEQLGLPVPATPVLLAFGALAGTGKMALLPGLALAVLASLTADLVWFTLGRRQGAAILRLLCKISLEPDSCVRRTENVFLRYGVRGLLFVKFVPGLNTAFPPLAGSFRMPVWKFCIFDGLGSLFWAGAYTLAGFLFHDQIDRVLVALERMGSWVLVLAGTLLGAYILTKYIQRRRFFHKLRVARISAAEVKGMMDRGEQVLIVDLRNSLEREDEPMKVPGAIALAFEDIELGLAQIPRNQDVVLYCT